MAADRPSPQIPDLARAQARAAYTDDDGAVEQHPAQHGALLDDALDAAAPALYRAWGKSRVEAVAELCARMMSGDSWDAVPEGLREGYRNYARAALGLEGEGDA